MLIHDLGLIDYTTAWQLQEEAHARVVEGGDEELFLLEHPSVITLGRRPGLVRNLVAEQNILDQRNIHVVQSDRGGDITFHGPGQLVAYPIIRLAAHGLSVGAYVRRLEDIVIATLAQFGIRSYLDSSAIGVWTDLPDGTPAKICALGVRIRKGVSLHGIALNVTTHLPDFNLIVPCGIADRPVTSISALLGPQTPDMPVIKQTFIDEMNRINHSRSA
jgi:lipoyl(octanoyl) transferase